MALRRFIYWFGSRQQLKYRNSGTLWAMYYSCPCTKHFYPSDSDLSAKHGLAAVGMKERMNFCPIGNIFIISGEVCFSAALRNMLLLVVLQEESYRAFSSATLV